MENTKATADGDSIEDELGDVREAFYDLFNPAPIDMSPVMPWIVETYPDYVIVCIGYDEYYKVAYTEDVSTEIYTFAPRDQWQAVEQQWANAATVAAKAGARNNKTDKQSINAIRQKAREIYNHTMTLDPKQAKAQATAKASGIEGMEFNTPEIAIKTAGDYELDVCYMPYSGQNNGKDADGEYFTTATKEYADKYPTPLVLYYHGYKAPGQPAPVPIEIGETGKRWQDKAGRWIKVKLDKTVEEARRVWASAMKGNARASSDSIAHLVRKKSTGEITHWAFVGISLFETETGKKPSNSYAFAIPAAKALGIYTPDNLESDASMDAQELGQITAAIVAAVLSK